MFENLVRQALDAFRISGVPLDKLPAVEKELHERFSREPDPRLALIGFTGVGKSSTINAIFNSGQAISDVRACTQEAQEIQGDVSEFTGSQGRVRVYDMPGLGEDLVADEKHLKTYAAVLPRVDVAVWTFHAGDRAMTPMQRALLTLQERIGDSFSERLIFAINKADATAPGESDWNQNFNIPSAQQKDNIEEFERYVREKVQQIWPRWNGPIVTYSARKRFRLESLMTAMVDAVGERRRWVLEQRADVADYTSSVDPRVLEYFKEHEDRLGGPNFRPWQRRREY